MMYVDQGFCSKNCPCKINNTTFLLNTTTALEAAMWVGAGNSTNFQGCSPNVSANYMDMAIASNPVAFNNTSIDYNLFYSAFAQIENKFYCNGWCETTYTDLLNRPRNMYKYMFSDINRGIPTYMGCMNKILSWLPGVLNLYGAAIIIGVIIMIFVWILAISLCYGEDSKEKVDENKNEKNEGKKDAK